MSKILRVFSSLCMIRSMYQHCAVAANFSPTLLPLLAESVRIAKTLDARLSLIHGDEADEKKAGRFQEKLEEVGWDGSTEIFWTEADTPLQAILQASKDSTADLLIAGALNVKNKHRHFLGDISHGLLRHSPCDVMLFPRPNHPTNELKTLVIASEFETNRNIQLPKIIGFQKRFNIPNIILLGVLTPFIQSKLRIKSRSDALKLLKEAEARVSTLTDAKVKIHLTESNTGFAACDFVQDLENSFLAVRGVHTPKGLELPSHMDWLYQVLPTNTWLLSERN
ncbi:MAG: universal stress protein [Chthoniobacterales bacterium]